MPTDHEADARKVAEEIVEAVRGWLNAEVKPSGGLPALVYPPILAYRDFLRALARPEATPERPESPSPDEKISLPTFADVVRIERSPGAPSLFDAYRADGVLIWHSIEPGPDVNPKTSPTARDLEWWDALVAVPGVACDPESVKRWQISLQECAREQGRREGLEQAARCAEEHEDHVDFTHPQSHLEPPYRCNVAEAIRALAKEETKG